MVLMESDGGKGCPFLPVVEGRLDAWVTRRHGVEKGAVFYRDALAYAQSHWLGGKPAQAILQLNKAWMAELGPGDGVLDEFPAPYRALVWMLRRAGYGSRGFLGNPVRHFQHLASRMSGPRGEVRVWRAWVCHHLAREVLDGAGFPLDGEQMVREGLWIPGRERALVELERRGWRGEADEARGAFGELG